MPNDMHTALLGEIRAEMGRRQVTKVSVARATDSDPATVGRWLSGKTAPRLDTLLTICSLHDITLEELARRAEANAQDGAA